ncbi:shikimate kinase [Halpernia frigidisoli]|uniref:Shikimate kinase n=1 Tax=Halpernia frigidisoli TaxID=1125876 RepID=A0A1I3FBS9_9FLAO|nr:shikimate kinase [Halpernia frigidisoli]SFI08604.1 shikimate kinase [Halpernia frigidisoli]
MIISLLGYMGSGKTHISKNLSKKLNYKLIDLDAEIMQKNQKSIPEIFADQGEIFFRKQEKEILEEILEQKEAIILSLGGGTPAYYNNIDLINQKSISVFLRTNISTLVERLISEKSTRPIIANIPEDELPEYIAKHLFERNFYYNQSKFTVSTDGRFAEEITEEIKNLIFV